MDIATAITFSLSELKNPVVLDYDIGKLTHHFFLTRKYKNEEIKIRLKKVPDKDYYLRIIYKLARNDIITQNKDFPSNRVFNIIGKERNDPAEIVCAVDPFAYVSHLSAMAHYSMTDRLPKILFITSPEKQEWTKHADDQMRKDFGEHFLSYFRFTTRCIPRLLNTSYSHVNGVNVSIYRSSHLGAFIKIRERGLRVSSIGRTFLDMVRSPKLCGGIRHVMDVYREFAPQYASLIIDEVEQHGKKIEKVRVGYLLDKECQINDPRINNWLSCVQRGSSQKLDAAAPYSHKYSEKWCLSLNVD